MNGSANRLLRKPAFLGVALASLVLLVGVGVVWLTPSDRAVTTGPQPKGSAAALPSLAVAPSPENTAIVRRPTRICPNLTVLDVQVGQDHQIEGAWLALGPTESPKLVALGQHFGPGILRHALLRSDDQRPEVWMQTDRGSCRASLPEEELDKRLVVQPEAPRPKPVPAPAAPPDAPSAEEQQRARRAVQALTSGIFGTSSARPSESDPAGGSAAAPR